MTTPLCVPCGHPAVDHISSGCTELVFGVNHGDVTFCECARSEQDASGQDVPSVLTDTDDRAAGGEV